MEMGLREILILVGVLLVGGIAFDGWRRKRRGRGNSLKMEAKPQRSRVEPPVAGRNVADFNPELPSGGARVVMREMSDAPAPVLGEVPILLDSSRQDEAVAPPPVRQVDMFGDLEIPAAQPAPAREIRDRGELPRREQAPSAAQRPAAGSGTVSRQAAAAPSAPSARAQRPPRQPPEEVIVIHVMAPAGERIAGKRLLESAVACGMRFGEFHIFHRYESGAHDALAMFSMANAVEPGRFDLDAMEQQAFVGASFFLMLPGPANTRQALDAMIETARRVAADVGGDLHDEGHSVLTAQTVEHLRQRISEYERRRLAQQRANG